MYVCDGGGDDDDVCVCGAMTHHVHMCNLILYYTRYKLVLNLVLVLYYSVDIQKYSTRLELT